MNTTRVLEGSYAPAWQPIPDAPCPHTAGAVQAAHQPADSPPCDWIPAVHAGMTGFNHLNITMSAGAWERSKS